MTQKSLVEPLSQPLTVLIQKAAVLDGFSNKYSKEVEYLLFLSIWATLKLRIEDILGEQEFMSLSENNY